MSDRVEMIRRATVHLLWLVCLCSCHPQQVPAQKMMMEKNFSVSGSLAGKVVLPCHFSIIPDSFSITTQNPSHTTQIPTTGPVSPSGTPHTSDEQMRIKWTKLEGEDETVVLVAQGGVIKVGAEYKKRVSVPSHPKAVGDASLMIVRLRASDAGLYRCEVMHGMEDSQDTVSLNVTGVVFHYRASTSRYSLDFPGALEACRAAGATIATPEQLNAAFEDGLDRCDAGWLSDQTVGYPITVPRAGCDGNLKNRPGVRSYGLRDPTETYDAYCYVDKLHGEVFYPPIKDKITLQQAREECEKHDAVLASPGQLFAAWRAGLNRCDHGWLSDGSVRYPITIPRPQCGGGQLGVRTLYKYENQTGYPDPTDRHGAFCFKAKLPEPTTTGPPTTTLAFKPDSTTPAPSLLSYPEKAQILNQRPDATDTPAAHTDAAKTLGAENPDTQQAGTPQYTTGRPTQRPHTATHRSDYTTKHEASQATTDPTSPHTTASPDYDDDYFEQRTQVESVPVREDTLLPMQLPPLPTTHSQSPQLDISHGGGQAGSGRGDRSGSGEGGSSEGSTSGVEKGVAATPTQVGVSGFTSGSGQAVETTPAPGRLPERDMPEPGLPGMGGEPEQPAVVYKENGEPGATQTFDLQQSLVIPADRMLSAKPPFHLIIVKVQHENQS
ncbi:hypothetical protein LDENG_00255430, partial [Lucifuga dentata]